VGITVTPNLGLIKPDINELIQDGLPTFEGWPGQNSDNMDVIDKLFRNDTASFTPGFTAGGVAVTLGSTGFQEGKLLRVFGRICVGYLRISMGTTGFVPGAGTYRINAPSVAPHFATEFTTFFESLPIGKAILLDNDNVATSTIMTVHYDLATASIHFRGHTGLLWNPTSPITLAQGDRVSAYFMYPTTDA
jgi:hypothetical protein